MVLEQDSEKFLILIIKIGIVFILFTPLIIGPFAISFSNAPKIVFFRTLIEFIFIFYLFLVYLNPKYLPKISVLVLAVAVFLGILILSSLTGINPYRSFFGDAIRAEGVILHLHLFLFFIILISVFNKKDDWFTFLKITVIVSAISSLTGILQKIGLFSFYGQGLPYRISGTLSNPSFFGHYISLAIFLSLLLVWLEKIKGLKILWLAILILNCLTLFLSGTRGAWIGVIAGTIFLAFFLFLNLLKKYPNKRKPIIFGLLIITIFIFLLVSNSFFYSSNNYFLERFFSILSFDSLAGRLGVWQISIEAFKDRPLLGWGPESFNYLFDKYFKAQYFSHIPELMYFDYPHNKILELMAGAGILGTLSYLSIFVIIFYLLFKRKNWLSLPSHPAKRGSEGLILASLFLVYFIINLSSFDTISTYLIFFLVLGFLYFYCQKKTIEKNRLEFLAVRLPKGIKIFIIFFFTIITLTVFYQINLKPALAGFRFADGTKYEQISPKEALLKYKEGISKKTIFDKDFRLFTTERLILILENSWAKDEEIKKEIIETLSEIKPFFERYLEKPDRRYLDHYKYLALMSQRTYLFSKDLQDLENMEKVLNEAISFNNQKPEFYRLMGEAKILQGKYREGEELFQKAFELTPQSYQDETNYYKYLGIAYLKAEDASKAGENFKKALDRQYYLRKFEPAKEIFSKTILKEVTFIQQAANFYYYKLNDFDTAKEIYERAMETYPQFQEIFQSQFDIIKEKQ